MALQNSSGAEHERGAGAAPDPRSDQAHAGPPRADTASPSDGEAFDERAVAGAGTVQPRSQQAAVDVKADERGHFIGIPSARSAPTRPRAKQNIPPALRRAILARDQGRCRVPGCTHTSFVDVHHIVPRSEGGLNDPDNLLTICCGHHRATHRGELGIERDPHGNLCFYHADGSPYGSTQDLGGGPELMDRYAKVFSALRHLGFRERDIRAVLAELRRDAELRSASLERLLREALRRIRIGRV
jgi:hypothetical protein